jgi:hypothetical protein
VNGAHSLPFNAQAIDYHPNLSVVDWIFLEAIEPSKYRTYIAWWAMPTLFSTFSNVVATNVLSIAP